MHSGDMSGYLELDATGFHVFPFGDSFWLRHSCGDTVRMKDPFLSTLNTAAIVHRMEGCKSGHELICGECQSEIRPDENYRHNSNRWVHVNCPDRVSETPLPQEGPPLAV